MSMNKDINHELCEMFGIDPNSCTGFNLRVRPNYFPTLTIQKFVTNGDNIKPITQTFEIKPLKARA